MNTEFVQATDRVHLHSAEPLSSRSSQSTVSPTSLPRPSLSTAALLHVHLSLKISSASTKSKKCTALRHSGVECRAPRRSISTPPVAVCLLDQFLRNNRTDKYREPVPARSRQGRRTALRVSSWGTVRDMHSVDGDPYTSLVTELRDQFPDLAYLHVVEPRVHGLYTVDIKDWYLNDFIHGIRGACAPGGYTPLRLPMKRAFGCGYIANPDLPCRLLRSRRPSSTLLCVEYGAAAIQAYHDRLAVLHSIMFITLVSRLATFYSLASLVFYIRSQL
ncbi:NADH:flavin oxidoreductase/NADH oxidase [Mycena sanguinolenta]|uniref:NADH:flavin oxidoreductase/NADH oxidase n=1 Tax=Mycena sanguinolenta TaxID=230812 RepID=A0A8H6XHU4_9AGAR|nr:NADH:flavin oxidoreductase/NADH oxidase [Mycena sanguinolenta]